MRVEAQRLGMLITIRASPDLENQSAGYIRHAVDVDAAIKLVRSFLDQFRSDLTPTEPDG